MLTGRKLSVQKYRDWLYQRLGTVIFGLVAACLFTIASHQEAWAGPIPPDGTLNLSDMGIIKFSSPTLVNLDGDAELEIVVGTVDGKVVVIDVDPGSGRLTRKWAYNTGEAFQKATTIRGAISAADLDKDGALEVVVPIGDVAAVDSAGGIVVLNASGGLLWHYETYDTTSDNAQPDGRTDGVIGSPALGDVDNDGDLEILFGSVDHRLYAFHHDGRLLKGWPIFIRDTVWPSPALADLNHNGTLEIIMAVDTHKEEAFGTPDGGGIFVFNADGSSVPGWPRFIEQVIYSSPAVADLDGDGSLEIMHGTGPFFNNPEAGYKLYVWNANGTLKWTGQTQGYVFASPAVGNIDSDPQLEVVVNSQNDQRTYAWNHDGSLLWSQVPRDLNGNSIQLATSPVLADYNGDGNADVFVTLFWESAILDGPTGNQFTATSFPNNPNPSYYGNHTFDSSPAIGDIDGDGLLELVLASANNGAGDHGQVLYWNLNTAATQSNAPWPMFGLDAAHTGYYRPVQALDAEVQSFLFPPVAQPGTASNLSLTFKNTGTDTWTANNVYLASINANVPAQLELPNEVPPGQTVTFNLNWQAPSEHKYEEIGWHLVSKQASSLFGLRASAMIKVGNQPALQVLTAEGIFAGGLSTTPLPGPQGLWNWSSSLNWKLTPDKRGYRLLDQYGAVWTGGNAMPLWAPAARSDVRELVLGGDMISYWVLTNSGFIFGCDPNGCNRSFNPAPPTNIVARSMALTPNGAGIYVVDAFGNLYTGGTAPGLPTAPGFPTTADVVIRMKLTKDGQGYYLLDKYGQVHAGGNAPALAPGYQPQLGVDWAIDFELTDDEKGYYLLVRDGTILPGGNAEPLTVNVPPVKGADFARDLELIDSRRSAPLPNLGLQNQQQNNFIATGDQRSLTFQNVIRNTGAIAVDWTMTTNWITGGNLPQVRVAPDSGVLQPGASQVVSIVVPNMGDENLGTYQLEVRASTVGGVATQTSTILIDVVDTVFDTYLPSTIK